ncbi:ArsR/SmtB family transcription factor [Fusibacter sp. JL216-2]|uniref:ArsR/SmtB family transcription factor n=1 Tax=Fusibacter sp. JL216-2 TaxID=3071453 RepID=UPI003D32A6F3
MLTSEYLKALADTNTLRIINLLLNRSLCVCELEALTDLKQSNLSRHLSKLSRSGIISRSKEAQWVFYSISEAFMHDHALLLSYLKDQFRSDHVFIQDSKRFEIFKEREMNCDNITQQLDILKI